MTEAKYRRLQAELKKLEAETRALVADAVNNRLGIPVRVHTYPVRKYTVGRHMRTRVTLWPRTKEKA